MSDPFLIQKAIKQNNNDLFEFSHDLKSWGEDMKRKEEALKKGNTASAISKKGPRTHKKVKQVEKVKSPGTKIGGTDYAAWDKFDVDAELEKLEEDLEDDSDLTDENNKNMYDEAIVEKEKGNKFVKNQEWEPAIKCYTKAIECYSYDPVFYANRALCYLKLTKFEEAENDCNLSLKLDDTYVKAYQRRAAARMMLNKLEHAEVDLQKVLIMEPNNKESKAELLKLSVILKRDREKAEQRPVSKFTASRNKSNVNKTYNTINPIYNPPKQVIAVAEKNIDDSKPISMWPKESEIIEVKPIKKPAHLRSQKPLSRIKITEVDGVVESKIKDEVPIKKHVTENREDIKKSPEEPVKKEVIVNTEKLKKSNEELVKKDLAKTEKVLESPKPTSVFRKQKLDEVLDKNDHSLPKLDEKNLFCLKTEDLKVIEKVNPTTTSKDIKNTVNDNKKLTETTEANVSFAYPKSSVQFFTSWKNFKASEDKYKYLKSIEPQDIPKLFLNSLDSSIFGNILEVMAQHFIENKDRVFEVLDSFTQVKRFGAIVMFMSYEDKSNVWKLLDYIKENNEKEKEDYFRLIEKFEL